MCATVHMWRPKDSFAEYGFSPSTVMCLLWFELTLSGLHSKIPFPVEPSHGPTQRWLLCSVVAGMRGFLICTTHNAVGERLARGTVVSSSQTQMGCRCSEVK